ncbi:MAG TPA: hypothetical protein VLA62_08215, partial [Solirubrobacterales bacterium]|nr:hypothetical protein [Solirubrobacterales bacterium]
GLAGQQPPQAAAEAPTRALGGTTEATRRLAPSKPPAAPARQAGPGPAPRPRQAPARARPRRSLAGRLGSAIGMILLIALLAAVIAAIVLLTTDAGQNTDLIKDTVGEQVDVLRDLVRENTQ